MKKLSFLSVLVIFLGLSLYFVSCSKDEDATTDYTTAENDAEASVIVDDVFNVSEQFGDVTGLKSNEDIFGCQPTVTVSGTLVNGSGVITKTVDFGTEGCTENGKRDRKGIIKIELTVTTRLVLKKVVTFENFSVNGFKVEGTHTITLGKDDQNRPTRTVVISNGKVTNPEGKTRTIAGTRTRTMIEGAGDLILLNDVFETTGEWTGTNAAGKTYTSKITKALNWSPACKWIRAGEVTTTEGTNIFTINYGDTPECDAKAIVTLNGKSKEISLR